VTRRPNVELRDISGVWLELASLRTRTYSDVYLPVRLQKWRNAMAWTTPVLIEICIGLEINGYLPAEF
jgi:coenzyme PQQ precursor peptide PqqA